MTIHRCLIKLMRVLLLALALAGCTSSKPIIDSRTGKPMMAGPWENRDLSLTTYKVNVFGKAILTHAYIQGVNISRCYSAAEQDDVRLLMVRFDNGTVVPGYVANRNGDRAETGSEFKINGIRKKNTITQKDGTKQEISWMQFDNFCGDQIAGAVVNLGIRNSASQSIDGYVADLKKTVIDHEHSIAFGKEYFIDPPQQVIRGNNKWTYMKSYLPAPMGDEWEDWLLPIGDSGYYLYLDFGSRKQLREAGNADYLHAHQLFNAIIDSVKVEKP